MIDDATRKQVGALFKQHFVKLLDFATSLSKNDGADLVAEAYTLIVEGKRAYDPSKPFEPFARSVIDSLYKNRRAMAHRALKREREVDEEVAAAPDPSEPDDPRREALEAHCTDKEWAYVELLEDGVLDRDEQQKRLKVTETELRNIRRRVEYAVKRVEEDMAKADRREDMTLEGKKR